MFETKLKPHLLNGDFFDAEKYPEAKFEITKVEPYTATGVDIIRCCRSQPPGKRQPDFERRY